MIRGGDEEINTLKMLHNMSNIKEFIIHLSIMSVMRKAYTVNTSVLYLFCQIIHQLVEERGAVSS